MFSSLFSGNQLPNLALVIVLTVLAFLVFRELLTWYWKLNRIIRILERIEKNLRKEGVKYPDDNYDEVYFRRNGIKLPWEGTEVK